MGAVQEGLAPILPHPARKGALMSDVSWGKALLHAVIVVFLFVAIGRAFAMIEAVPNPDRIGEAKVLALCAAFVVAVAASAGLQSGQTWLLVGGVIVLVALLGLQVHAFLTLALEKSFTTSPLTAEDRKRPETRIYDHKARLCQNSLGFYLPHPDGFEPLTTLDDKLNGKFAKQNPNIGEWAYANFETNDQILLLVAKDVGKTEESFRAFTRGIRGVSEKDSQVALGDETFKWADGAGEYNLAASTGSAQMEMRCLSRAGGGLASTVVVCAQTVTGGSEDEDLLRRVRDGLRLVPCV
jgi:hypothetical protein